MKSSDSIKLGVVGAVALVGIIIMTLISTYNINGYYGFAAREKGNIQLAPALSFEAEIGTGQGFAIGEDPRASSNSYIYSPDGSGTISYSFDVDKSGLYKISTKVATTSPYAQHNSFYVQLNDYERVLVDAHNSENNYKWNVVSTLGKDSWLLEPGKHTVKIDAVDSNVKIDSVSLSLFASQCADNDKDGYGKPRSELCTYNVADCNDRDTNINPGATEICDNRKDDNCDGRVNEGCDGSCVDADNDGYGEDCSAGPDCDDNNPDAHALLSCNYNGNVCYADSALCMAECPVPPQEICGNEIDEDCDGVVEECAGGDYELSRSFSENTIASNSVVTVTLTRTLESSQTTLLVEEIVPTGFTIVDVGTGVATGNTIRWAALTNAASGTYIYTVSTPVVPGTYTFSGAYSINGGSENAIGGVSSLTVESIVACQNGATQSCTTNLLGICGVGTQTCSNNVWGTCNAPSAQTEICGNGIDEDCNGVSEPCTHNNTFAVDTLVQAESGNNNGFTIENGYVYPTDSGVGSISYTFDVPQSGQYVIDTGIVDPDGSTDSFYVGLDGVNVQDNDAYIYDTLLGTGVVTGSVRLRGPNGNFSYWMYDPMIYTLSAGEHTITFYARELTKMDYLKLRTYDSICPLPACAAPPEGCYYVPQVDSNGCSICGELVCDIVGDVSRSFSEDPTNVNSLITVTLTKTLQSTQSTILVEETVPSGFTIVDSGTGLATGNTIRWAELTGASSGIYTYTVRTPIVGNTFSFSGFYTINGGSENAINGDNSLVVQGIAACQNGATQSCTTDLSGICAKGTQICDLNEWTQCVALAPQTEICGNNIDEDCNGVSETCQNLSSSLARSISVNPASTNSVISIAITKTLHTGQNVLLTEEVVPAGFSIVDAGEGSAVGNTIRWVELNGATSGVYTYTVRTPSTPGTYTFSGAYTINGGSEIPITSDTQLVVQGVAVCQNGATQSCTTNLLGVCGVGTQTCSNNNWGTCVAPTTSTEVCNNDIDEDCDGTLNNGCTGFCDTDNDGHNQVLLLWCAIYGPIDDCNDNNANVYPGATEICGNGIDEDCSGSDLMCANTPPIVSISSPVTGSIFNVSSTINLVALASDPNGSISKVEFYRNNALIGQDSSFPYSYEWTNAQVGNYTIYARAYDNLNSTTNSATISLSVITLPISGGISRSFSTNPAAGDSLVDVTLTKTLSAGQSTVLVEEIVPAGFTIVSSNIGAATGNTIRWAELIGAVSGTYTYTVRTPSTPGDYSFTGSYSVNGGAEGAISGAYLLGVNSVVACQNGATQSCTTNLLGICGVGTQTCSNNVWGTCNAPSAQTEVCGNNIDENCNGVAETCLNTSGLSRSYSVNPASGDSVITVTLTKTLQPGQGTILTEETVPSSFTIVSSGTGSASGNIIRWAELTGASSGTYTYTVRTPTTAGTYSFFGLYTINGGSEVTITGSSLVVGNTSCQSGVTQSCTTNLLGICGVGTQTCSNNIWSTCVAPSAQTEICGNGIDEDCNGITETCQNTTAFAVNTLVQAESGNNNGFTIVGGITSNGYVYTDVSGNNSISYAFNVPQFGQYVIDTGIVDPNSGTNSFYIGLDGDSAAGVNSKIYDTITGTGTTLDTVRLRGVSPNDTYAQFDPMIFTLTAGTHTFTFYGRERLTKMDYLKLSEYDATPVVCNSGQTQSCSVSGAQGICAAGTRTCSSNVWGACVAPSTQTEICGNGVDEDCNGVDLACPNILPTVSIINPISGTDFAYPSYVSINVTASDSDGSISKVDIYADNVLMKTDTTVPYTYTWTNAAAGAHLLKATAYDNMNGSRTSSIVTITMVQPIVCTSGQTQSCSVPGIGICSTGTQTCSNNAWGNCVAQTPQTEICGNNVDENCNGVAETCNGAPSVFVGSDQTITLPSNSTLTGNVTDDGLPNPPSSTTVAWTKQSGPGTVTFSNVNGLSTRATFSTSGTYVLRLTASDSLLTAYDTLTVNVLPQPVNQLPTVSIFSPASGTNFLYPSYVTINATASDSDGSISKVEIYANNVLLRNDTTAPYSYTWTNAAVGTHSITARAYDNQNGVTTSSPVSITIVQPVCTSGQTQSCNTNLLGVCATGTQTCTNNAWGSCVAPSAQTEVCGNNVDENCNGVAEVCASNGLSRSFSSNPAIRNTVITVTVTKTLLAGQSTVLVEEYVPAGYTIVSPGTGSATGNTIRWAELIGAVSGTYTYTVRTPNAAGTGMFSGMYSINGGAETPIGGTAQLTVQ